MCFHLLLRFGSDRVRVVVVYNNHVLLVQPWYGRHVWTLPGGGVKKHESNQQAAARELCEETGIAVTPDSLLYVGEYSCSESHKTFNVSGYYAVLSKKVDIKPSYEIIKAQWFPIDELPSPLALPIKQMLPTKSL